MDRPAGREAWISSAEKCPQKHVEPCPECGTKLIETGRRIARSLSRGFEGRRGRDVALRKIEKKGLSLLEKGSSAAPTAPDERREAE